MLVRSRDSWSTSIFADGGAPPLSASKTTGADFAGDVLMSKVSPELPPRHFLQLPQSPCHRQNIQPAGLQPRPPQPGKHHRIIQRTHRMISLHRRHAVGELHSLVGKLRHHSRQHLVDRIGPAHLPAIQVTPPKQSHQVEHLDQPRFDGFGKVGERGGKSASRLFLLCPLKRNNFCRASLFRRVKTSQLVEVIFCSLLAQRFQVITPIHA